MATYTYNCNNMCGKFEVNQSMLAPPITKCPHCGSSNIERIWKATNNVWHTSGGFSKANHSDN